MAMSTGNTERAAKLRMRIMRIRKRRANKAAQALSPSVRKRVMKGMKVTTAAKRRATRMGAKKARRVAAMAVRIAARMATRAGRSMGRPMGRRMGRRMGRKK